MTTEQLAALKEVAEKPDLKSWKQGGNYWSDRTVADTHGNTFIADCGDNARSSDVAAFIAAFDPATCKELMEQVEQLAVIAEAARDFIWEPENWEAYQESKESNSAAWPPEFLLLAQAVEKQFGSILVDEDVEQP